MKTFDEKIALVTGGSSGIGRATALAFARAGAKVALADVNIDTGQETEKLIRAEGGEAEFIHCDVSRFTDIKTMIDIVIESYGKLDLAYNNAGTDGELTLTADSSEENWNKVINTNLKSVWACMKFELAAMMKSGGGVIVNRASVASLGGFPAIGAYVASKHGILGLTKTAALEYGKFNIRVNAVCPGMIDTPLVKKLLRGYKGEGQKLASGPLGRMGTPEEIANAVIWLCSNNASFVNGHPLVIDGGLSAS